MLPAGFERRLVQTSPEANQIALRNSDRNYAAGELFALTRTGFADYAFDGETLKELRARVNNTILEDLEEKGMALRALHAKLHHLNAGASLGDVVARSRPTSSR
jgi:hypothetical protein